MPRPRFAKLDEHKQALIFEAAEAEFAEHGFHDASFNRIIAAAGVSKGAMYYYFDDKADLFASVMTRAASGLVEALGSVGVVDDVDGFWSLVEDLLGRATDWFAIHPRAARLARQLVAGDQGDLPGLHALYETSDRLAEELLRAGQDVAAVRRDLPLGLLARLVNRAGESFDVWIARHGEELKPEQIQDLHRQALDVIRRIVEPR